MHLVLLLLLMQASLAATGLALLAWWRNPSTASATQYAIFSIAVQMLLVIYHAFIFTMPPISFPQAQSIQISLMVLLWIVLIMFSSPDQRKRLFVFQTILIFGILTLQFMITGLSLMTLSTVFTIRQFVPENELFLVLRANTLGIFCNTLSAGLLWVAVIYAGMQAIRFLRRGPRSGRAEQMAIFIRLIRVSLIIRFLVPVFTWGFLIWLDHFEIRFFFFNLLLTSVTLIVIRYLYGFLLPMLIIDYAGHMLGKGQPRVAAVSILTLPFMVLIAEVLAAGLTKGWGGVSF